MTSQRCPDCARRGVNGRLRLDPDNKPGWTPIWKCKACGKEFCKVKRSWRRV